MKLFEEFELYENMWNDNAIVNKRIYIPANQLNQIAGNLLFSRRKKALYGSSRDKRPVTCPGEADGCAESFLDIDEYNAHIVNCKKARKYFNYPARIKNKKAERRLDIIENKTAGELLNELDQHTKCELCEVPIDMEARRPDHYHLEVGANGVGNGHFRGILCDRCNTFMGKLEKLLIDDGVNIDKITEYLSR